MSVVTHASADAFAFALTASLISFNDLSEREQRPPQELGSTNLGFTTAEYLRNSRLRNMLRRSVEPAAPKEGFCIVLFLRCRVLPYRTSATTLQMLLAAHFRFPAYF